MMQHIPNILTIARLIMSVVLFILLSLYRPREGWSLLLDIALIVFLAALLTDFLDGFLARRWRVDSKIGRIIDPLADKILVLGSFILLLGDNFSVYKSGEIESLSGIVPWMVVILLLRELLITGLRSLSEGKGHNFAAAWSGKIKMVMQSATIVIVLIYVNYRTLLGDMDYYAQYLRDACIWLMLAVTLLSGALYIRRALMMTQKVGARDEGLGSRG